MATSNAHLRTVGDGPGPDCWQPPRAFDGYVVRNRIGGGAMGDVYLAYDELLDRPVALKFIHAALDADGRERFLAEARAIARLQHPNVVTIYRAGFVDTHPYIASEYVRGVALDCLPLPLPPERALRIGLELARGLAAAHRRRVLHRDIKPANAIFSDEGEVKLLDFGVARLLEGRDAEATERAGAFVGTPAYVAPEIWRGEAATFRSDVYSLGALLYHLCSGRPPHEGRTLRALGDAVLGSDAPPLATDPALAAVVRRCLSKDPSYRYASGEELRDALEGLTPERRACALPDGNPYRGLLAFEAEHRSLFFGRDAEVRAAAERLRAEPLVVIAGASGVGKSSLCRAGVLPRIRDGALDGRRWTVAVCTPGKRPLAALATAIAPWLGEPNEEDLAARLRQPREAVRELRRRQAVAGPLVVFVDQLEELTTVSEPAEAAAVAALIEELAVPGPGLRLLATVRADFLARVGALGGLANELSRSLQLLPPMSAENVREVVVGPAHAKGVSFESDELVRELVQAGCRSEAALPLLQFTLAELWRARDVARGVITAQSLAAVGGVDGALARHADQVLSRLLPAQRRAARRMLPLLVPRDGTRARRTELELTAGDAHGASALAELVRGRLVAVTQEAGAPAYEVAHEALVASWPTLKRWLEEDADRRELLERLAAAISEWERVGRRRDALWSARQLAEAARLEASELRPEERRFLEESRRRLRRRRWAAVAGALAMAMAIVGAALGARWRADLEQANRAARLVDEGEALLENGRSRAAEAAASRQRAFAAFDRGDANAGEAAWGQAAVQATEAESLLARAGQVLESAALTGAKARASAALASALDERARLAEALGRPSLRNELLARLSLYDDRETLVRRWRARARLDVDVTVAASWRALYRFDSGPDGRLEVVRVNGLDGELELEPGSYLVVAAAPGRAEAKLPLLVSRGARHHVRLDLPDASEVGPGFAYVPEGQTLFGSATDDRLRRDFLRTVPMHPVHVGAFAISVHETTFGDWLEYLKALPRPERERAAPSIDAGGFRGELALEQVGARWRLRLRAGKELVSAFEGEPIVFPGRSRRASVDWRKLPVVGISWADAEQYLAWLDRTGRVRGARFCTELEWERAARGADGRTFPHGESLREQDANFDETHGRDPSAMGLDEVGAHPASRSPFGVDDLSGNVWEWTRSSLPDAQFVVRGGGWSYGRSSARADNREPVEPTLEDLAVGLRVCRSISTR